ncbi:hypothetical protein [Runella sp.]|uniref:hypothetical protein n=1 Tax=Runella sp. TaxID=1960881 RepID=UPI003D0E2F1D
MKTAENTSSKMPSKGLMLVRRLAAEKREIQRQMQEEFATDPQIQKVVIELEKRSKETSA